MGKSASCRDPSAIHTPPFQGPPKKLDEKGIHDAIKRNSIRLLQFVKIPRQFQGEVMDKCFKYLVDSNEKAAVKANALTVLQNLAFSYPDIIAELRTILETQNPHESFAFRARAKKILKVINDDPGIPDKTSRQRLK